jgi:hypothetical protein
MTTTITLEFTEQAAEAIGDRAHDSLTYGEAAHLPQPGDFVELEHLEGHQTFFVIGRVFSLKADTTAVKLALDLPPADEHQDFDPAL